MFVFLESFLVFLILMGDSGGDPSQEMEEKRGKAPRFSLNKIKPHLRLPVLSKLEANSAAKTRHEKQNSNAIEQKQGGGGGEKPGCVNGRRIMIVVDSSGEGEGAIQWASSHTIQSHDKVCLLTVVKPCTQGGKDAASKAHKLCTSMKRQFQMKRPEVEMDVIVVEGREKGPTIVEEANKQGASLLVIGQKKRSTAWRLLMIWAAGNGIGPAEYCINNAHCMAIAVRKKSKKHGGYLITTKRQKDFWLLA